MMNKIHNIIKIIKKNIGHRRLICRCRNEAGEAELSRAGLDIDFFVTASGDKVDPANNIFPDDILSYKSNEYYLLIWDDLKFSDYENRRYEKMGFSYMDDVCWASPRPVLIDSNGNKDHIYHYSDCYGNSVSSRSKIKFKIAGSDNHITIGVNTTLPELVTINNNSNIIVGDNCILNKAHLFFSDNVTLNVKDSVLMDGTYVFINYDSQIVVGAKTTLNTGRLLTGRNQKVEIGEDCMFSFNTNFLPHDGHLIWDIRSKKSLNNTTGSQRNSVRIGDHVWIGGDTTFLANTNVGTGSIIGYRSLINCSFPNNVLLVGSPAKILKENIAWSRNNISLDEEKDFLNIPEEYRRFTSSSE